MAAQVRGADARFTTDLMSHALAIARAARVQRFDSEGFVVVPGVFDRNRCRALRRSTANRGERTRPVFYTSWLAPGPLPDGPTWSLRPSLPASFLSPFTQTNPNHKSTGEPKWD